MSTESTNNGGPYTISDAQINFAGIFAYASTIPGTIVCGGVLIAYAIVAISRDARECLDRVSFRLLVYSLAFNVFFGIAYATTPTSPGGGCSVGAFFVNFTLCFATFFTTCIAMNLQLVLVHGFDGKAMEKYYLIGTIVLSLALNIPAVALGQFGWNDFSATCWYSNPDDKIRLRWVIGTQSFWISLAATIETICSAVVLFWLYRFQRTITSFTNAASLRSTVEKGSGKNIAARNQLSSSSRSHSLVTHDLRFQRVVLRIALYPIVSLLMNYSTVVLDLYVSILGVNTQLDFRLLVLDLTLYGLRTFAYGILAASDPSFVNAVKLIRGSGRRRSGTQNRTLTDIHFIPGRGNTSRSHTTVDQGAQTSVQTSQSEGLSSKVTSVVPHVLQLDEETSRHEIEKDEIRKLERQI